MKNLRRISSAVLLITVAWMLAAVPADACTRCMRVFADGNVIVGRSMDWVEDPGSEIWVFPRGMKRHGNAGPGSIEWTSRLGSVGVSFYGVATADGMNEKGLVANMLYLAESDYGTVVAGRPNLSISDPSGDSAIFEYIGGRLKIHHGRAYTVMTNSPPFDEQLALNAYWRAIGGDVMLPGTIRASDRFVRASFYIDAIPASLTGNRALAAVFSVIRNASAPLGITTPGEPNVASTIWRTVHDQQDRTLYFESATSPTVFWVPLERLDFTTGSPVKRLPLKGGETYSGDAAGALEAAEPFVFLEGTPLR